jgi:hypothetical protein
LLIGVATYSLGDLELLDQVQDFLAKKPAMHDLSVEVFDVSECRKHGDFKNYIPSLGKVFQTPVAGLWDRGELREQKTGAAARELILSVCNSSLTSEPPMEHAG